MGLRITTAVATCVLLSACSGMPDLFGSPALDPDPLEDVERLSDVTVAADADAVAIAAPDTGGGGLFSGLMSAFSGGATGAEAAPSADTTGAATDDISPAGQVTEAAGAAQPQPSGFAGLLGLGARSAAPDAAPANRSGPDAQTISFGTQIPFGQLATVCDAPAQPGTRIASVSGYTVYDSIPNSTALRPHYITGFADGCARQFTAAMSLMGDVGTHEVVRYNRANNRQPYSATDTAYEAIKASFCRVSHGTPCGARLDALAANTTFLSVYERFGTNGKWFEILLHEGRVLAAAIEDH